MNFFRRIRPILIGDALIFIFILFGIYRAMHKAGIPGKFIYEKNQVHVVKLKKQGNSIPLKSNDVILSVNHHNIDKIEDIEFICDACSIHDDVSITILRDAKMVNLEVRLAPFYTKTFVVLIGMLGMLFLVLGIFVLVRLPQKDEAYVYHWLSISVALVVTTTWGRFSVLPFAIEHIVRVAFSIAYTFTPSLFVHLSYIFPVKKQKPFKIFMPMLYTVSGLLAGWQIIAFLVSVNISLMDGFHEFRFAYNTSRWFFAACILLGIGNFFHSYFNAEHEVNRRKLLWILLGLVVGPLIYILFWQIPQAVISRGLIPEELVIVFLATAPVSFSIAILRYRILDIDLIFRRSSVYFFVFSGMVVIYAGIVGTAAAIVTYVGMFTLKASLISSAVAAVIVALLFDPVRRRVQVMVDKWFFRVRYNYRIAQNRFTKSINQSYNIDHIIEFTIQELEALLHPRCIAFYLRSEQGNGWQMVSERNWVFTDTRLIAYLSKYFFHSAQIISLQEYIEADIDFLRADPEIFHQNKVALAISCKEKSSESSGFLIMGRKKATPIFSQEDVDLLRTIASHVGLAIEHIRLQRSLMMEQAEAHRLDELNRLKSFFVSSVSHELQTPLTSIRMFAELLRNKKNISAKDKKDYLEIIEGESERLTRLINNVLDFSRIERGVKEYTFIKIDVREVIDKVLHSMMFQIKQYGFRISTRIPEEEIIINADRDALHEALVNLISNAIKYAPSEKEIILTVAVEKDHVRFSVQDRGIGISEGEQHKIFDIFYRSRDAFVQSSGGAGLGLTIVNHIVKAHKGTIDVQSSPGKGSTFTIILPLESSV